MWHRFGVEPTLQGFWRTAYIEKDEQDEENWSMLFQKLEILSGSYSPTFCLGASSRTAKELFESSSGCVHSLKYPSACYPQTLQAFPLAFRLFRFFLFVFDDLSAAMTSSSSRVELSSSCSSSPFVACFPPKSRRNQLESLGYLLLSFVLFVRSYFSFKCVSKFSSRDILAIKTNL